MDAASLLYYVASLFPLPHSHQLNDLEEFEFDCESERKCDGNRLHNLFSSFVRSFVRPSTFQIDFAFSCTTTTTTTMMLHDNIS